MIPVMTDEERQQMLFDNIANYGQYGVLVKNHSMNVDASTINAEEIDQHIDWIFNIFKDGIDQESVQTTLVFVTFTDGVTVKFSLEDYLLQLIFWKLPTSINEPLTSETLFWAKGITTGYICRYVNRIFIKKYIAYIKRNNIQMDTQLLMNMNVNINETFEQFKKFTKFQMFLNNTLNLKDTIDMMNKYPEFNDTMHLHLAGTPLSEVNRLGMEAARKQIEYITAPDSDHCLKVFFQSGECLSIKQYKEVSAHVGPKPNGEGGIIPSIIDSSYLNGGLWNPEFYTIDASASRVAQMLSHENVGRSGDFARILELNSQETKLHPDSRYKCNTVHTIRRYIKDQQTLNIYNGRYYRFRRILEDGHEPDKVIDAERDTHLIGKTIEIYSPMTCASRSRGEGICYRCYGDLAYTNFNINIGVIATELVSSRYTQKQLSAKHLLEAHVRELVWNNAIENILEINFNTIRCYEQEEYVEIYKGMKLIINTGDFDYEDKNDDLEFNAYVTSFRIVSNGQTTEYHTENGDNIYLSNDVNEIIAEKIKAIRYYEEEDIDITIDMEDLMDCDEIFLFHIDNDELSRIVNGAKRILNKGAETSKYTKDEIIEAFCDINLSGGFDVESVHYEVVIANQMRDADDLLEWPDWTKPSTNYQILTLNKSLIDNPCVGISLQFQKIAQQLWKPITYIKKRASSSDLYFMIQPQPYIHSTGLISDTTTVKIEENVQNCEECVSFNKNLIGKGDFH